MKSPLKVYVVGGPAKGYVDWIGDVEYVYSINEADLVVFTGGVDVDPALYGEPRHPQTEPSNNTRDVEEVVAFSQAEFDKKPMLGICRGAQFLCVMAGGKLVQHQYNPGGHPVLTHDPDLYPGQPYSFYSPAYHHQAAFPWPIKDFRVLGYTAGLSPYHLGGKGEEMVCGMAATQEYGGYRAGNDLIEIEDVYYPKINALGIQSHPEWAQHNSECVIHYRKLVNLLMEGKL